MPPDGIDHNTAEFSRSGGRFSPYLDGFRPRSWYEDRFLSRGRISHEKPPVAAAQRPDGAIKDSDFKLVETDVPTPGEGEVLVRNLMLSCDPTQRGWIAFDTYLPAVKIGEVVRSLGAGRIVTSNHPDFAVGDVVSGLVGWQDHVVMKPQGHLNKLPSGAPLELAMGALGLTGLTAYFGLLDVGRPVAGETVVVSGAAGATGSVVGRSPRSKAAEPLASRAERRNAAG